MRTAVSEPCCARVMLCKWRDLDADECSAFRLATARVARGRECSRWVGLYQNRTLGAPRQKTSVCVLGCQDESTIMVTSCKGSLGQRAPSERSHGRLVGTGMAQQICLFPQRCFSSFESRCLRRKNVQLNHTHEPDHGRMFAACGTKDTVYNQFERQSTGTMSWLIALLLLCPLLILPFLSTLWRPSTLSPQAPAPSIRYPHSKLNMLFRCL